MNNHHYVLHPGYVTNPQGVSYFVQARDLIPLYGISGAPFTIDMGDTSGNPHNQRERFIRWPADAIHLYPREDGNYDLT
jgi:hypothetical protein